MLIVNAYCYNKKMLSHHDYSTWHRFFYGIEQINTNYLTNSLNTQMGPTKRIIKITYMLFSRYLQITQNFNKLCTSSTILKISENQIKFYRVVFEFMTN